MSEWKQGDLFEPEPEPVGPVRGAEGRNEALANFEVYRSYVVEQLRTAAWAAWEETHQPVSVNDIRYVLQDENYDGDPRILGAAFPHDKWVKIGHGLTDSRLANAREVGLFVPSEWTTRGQNGVGR